MARARGSSATPDGTATSAVVGHAADDAKGSNSQADQNEEAHRSHSLDLRKGTLIGFRIGATCSVLTHNGKQPAHRKTTTLGAVGWQCKSPGGAPTDRVGERIRCRRSPCGAAAIPRGLAIWRIKISRTQSGQRLRPLLAESLPEAAGLRLVLRLLLGACVQYLDGDQQRTSPRRWAQQILRMSRSGSGALVFRGKVVVAMPRTHR